MGNEGVVYYSNLLMLIKVETVRVRFKICFPYKGEGYQSIRWKHVAYC